MRAKHVELVIVLGALSAFGPISMDTYLPALPEMARDLDAPAWATQLTITTSMIGLALGQLLAGSISDARGRRTPLLIGVFLYMVTSLLCAFAPSIWWLLLLRLIQGMAGGAGIVIARAIVRDLHSGVAAARFFARLILVSGLAPILGPIGGAQLLHVTDWRGIFVALAITGAALLVAAFVVIEETLPVERRHGGGLPATLRVFSGLLRDGVFMGYALSQALVFAAMATYIAGSPFVLQDLHGVTPQVYALIFGLNAAGIIVASQISRALVVRHGPWRLLVVGVAVAAVGTVGVFVAVVADLGLGALLVSLLVMVSSTGIVQPNATALALADHPHTAGSASALVGLTQFAIGATAAPLAGVGGSHTAVPMALVITACTAGAVTCLIGVAGRHRVRMHA